MRIGHRRFSPTLFGTLLTLVGLALFLRLGFWQLERADEKAALAAQFSAGAQTTAELAPDAIGALTRYQHVRARGRYDAQRQILLDNMPSAQGRPGYRVLTPFTLDSGGWVLVDRGWIALGARRELLPTVSVGELAREVRGRIDELPRPGLRLAAQTTEPEGPWPRVLNFPEHAQLERVLGRPLAPTIVLLDEREPDGYERRWQMHFRVEPERHIAYAVQWFAFALVAIILFLIMSFKRSHVADEPS